MDYNGQPLAAITTAANGDERKQVMPLIEQLKLRRIRKQPTVKMIILEGDRGYDANWLRMDLLKINIFPGIPRRRIGKPKNSRPCFAKVTQYFKLKLMNVLHQLQFDRGLHHHYLYVLKAVGQQC